MPRVYNRHHKDYPKEAVYIGRGSPWGNPFVIGKDGTREEVISKYETYFRALFKDSPALLEYMKKKLAGKDLVCYCAPKACHGDVLLKLVNEDGIITRNEEANGSTTNHNSN